MANAFFMGMASVLAYLILLGFRAVIPHNSFFLGVEDFLFCVILSLKVFLLAMQLTFGELRWYIFVGIGSGALIMALFLKKIRNFKAITIKRALKLNKY
ncbi:MAG: spore cortex biosynthesis protein YabQ [Oscillospiraceae bacterium]